MHANLRKLSFFLLFYLSVNIGLVGQAENSEGVKVGLALSGGGAKGLAHVGVLKVLEEAGIRPDYITGTSMGSVIGGLYAMGYDVATLDSLVRAQDWDRVMSDRIPLDEVVMEEKIYFENELIEFPFDGIRIKAPSGLIYGQEISKLLNKLTLPAYEIEKFEELPVPFQCIGSDIVKGEALILNEGVLPEAMRISMAIPTVFTPIKQDSILFVDGGLIHNFPVKEVKDMGADIIIGVYTGRKLADEENLESFSDILLQSVFLLGIQDAELQQELCDVYIEPELGAYSALDFNEYDSIIHKGEKAARVQFERLKELGQFLKQYQKPANRKTPKAVDSLFVDQIEVEGNRLVPTSQIRGRFGLEPGHYHRVDEIEAGIDALFGTNYFKRVTYRIRKRAGENILRLRLIEKAATNLRLALNYDSYLEAGILFNLSFRNSLLPASRFIFGAKIAVNYRLNMDYLKYLDDRQETAVKLNVHFNRDEIPIYQDGIQSQEFRVFDFLMDLRAQRRVGDNFLTGIGIQREQLSFRPQAGTNLEFENLNYTNHNVYAFATYNSLDRNNFPRAGTQVDLVFKGINHFDSRVKSFQSTNPVDADSLFNKETYFSLRFQMKSYLPTGERSQFRVSPFLGVLFNSKNAFEDFFLVGSPSEVSRRSVPFYGLDANELVAESMVGGNIGFEYFVRDNLMVSLDASVGWFSLPLGFRSTILPVPDLFLAGTGLTFGYDSFLGPIRFSFMLPAYTEGGIPGKLRTFLHIGHRF